MGPGGGTACTLPASTRLDATLSLPRGFLQAGKVFEFTVTVTAAPSGNCQRTRTATERRVIVTTRVDHVPEIELNVCKDPLCNTKMNLVGGVATINANRRKPNLFVRLQVKSQCPARQTEVGWSTSMDAAHIMTTNMMQSHGMKHAGHETLKIKFNYALPIAAKYTFSVTAKCGMSSTIVSVDIEMNYGPSGGKMEVRERIVFNTFATETFNHCCVCRPNTRCLRVAVTQRKLCSNSPTQSRGLTPTPSRPFGTGTAW